jgi:transcription-repair coupling factor (superfamily II helicase)
MILSELIDKISGLDKVDHFFNQIQNEKLTNIAAPDCSFQPMLFRLMLEKLKQPVIVITSSDEVADKYYDDLRVIYGTDKFVKAFHYLKGVDSSVQELRNIESFEALEKKKKEIYIFTPETIIRKVAIRDDLVHETYEFIRGKDYEFIKITEILEKYLYEKKDFVELPGDYSIRGGLIDIFPYVSGKPFRLEFFGDMIESIREFDLHNQRSIGNIESFKITPNFLDDNEDATFIAVNTLLEGNSILFFDGIELIEKFISEMDEEDKLELPAFYEKFESFKQVRNHLLKSGIDDIINFGVSLHPNYNSSIKIASQEIDKLFALDYEIHILSEGMRRSDNIKSLFDDYDKSEDALKHDISYIDDALQNGFIIHDEKLAVLTEHEIFGRTKGRMLSRKKKIKGFSAHDIGSIKPGDYIVHIDYGVGRFEKLQKIKIGDADQECVKLSYQDGDSLFVNLNYINRLKKYSSSEGVIPRISKLGSGEWDKLKSRTKKKIKDIARNLITLYAKRKSSEGFAFNPDTVWQKELESSFIYEDTPDQVSATEEVKKDMENSSPMDRLICGDVGYGKTEVAVRAAFKSVMDGKQVAVLVPTTILAEQHYKTFTSRLKNFPVNIAPLSRFQNKKEQTQTLEKVKEKNIDILIGTHRLLSKDVEFKDLGLLIVDEEQRFGVSAKEKLREVRVNVDTLTLTATPIPRTLNFSLMGARDLSVIETPPKNRLPIETEIIKFDEKKIRQVIIRELAREGQVYIVHDRVNNIEVIAEKFRKIVPEAKLTIAHGQMTTTQLEKKMFQFLDKQFDILLTTKIIESGLDIPNVNTILINHAERFGLAELYQLRGRVGRSNSQAYAYFIIPGFESLTKKALQRLQAIEEFTELSSGFNLAMRDMEIRGVGNFLGGEQSGFIESVGFETYCKILDESVDELKKEEFKDIFNSNTIQFNKKVEALVEIDRDAYFPDTFISNDSERFNYYQKLYDLDSTVAMDDLKEEIIDKFGRLPKEANNLFKIGYLRIYLSELKINKMKLKENKLKLFFKSENFSDDVSFALFNRIIEHLKKLPDISYNVKEIKEEVVLNITIHNEDVSSFNSCIKIIQEMHSKLIPKDLEK